MNHFKSLPHPVLASACNCGHSSIKNKREEPTEDKNQIDGLFDNLTALNEVL